MTDSSAPPLISHSNTALLSPTELSSIISLAHSNSSTAFTAEQQRRAALQTKSITRSSQWPNTLQAQRSLKKAQHELKRQLEENRNLRLDAEEAQYRAGERQRIVDRANALLYKDKDSVRNLQTGLNLSKIQHDRRLQMEEKAAAQRDERNTEAKFVATAEATRLSGNAKEEAKIAQQKASRLLLAETQMQQLDAFRAKQAALLAEEGRDGDHRRQVEEAMAQEAREEEEAKVQAQRNLNKGYLIANEDQLVRKAERAKWEAAEAARVQVYAEEKEATLQQRKQREGDLRRTKAAMTQKMLDNQFSHLSQLREKEGARIDRQLVELEEKAEAMSVQKQRMREERVRTEQDTRKQQIARKKEEQEVRDREETTRLDAQEKEAREAQVKEVLLAEVKRKAARETMEAQRVQVKEKAAWQKVIASQQAVEDKVRIETMAKEDSTFDAFAAVKVAELESKGYDTTPVKLALEAERMRKIRLKV